MKKLLERLKSLTILYAEDDPDVKKSVTGYLELVFGHVVGATTGTEAYERYESGGVDVVLTDIDMPGLNGIDLAKKIRAIDQTTPIIIMTAHTKPEYLIDAVELNITRYLVKPFVGEALLGALEKSFAQAADGPVSITGQLFYDTHEKQLIDGDAVIPLTVKESRLLELFLRRKNQLLSQEEIERYIWEEEFVTDSALRALIKNLRKKLPVDCIKNQVGLGYKLVTGEG